ncbi:MAG: response regulator transcription factor [Actinobacteria bacterium]|nr:response regulator transcription factor [Actinomycetota bacterium]
MSGKVLFVEDEINLHEVVSAYLKNEGFEMVSAYTGNEAEEIIAKDLDKYVAIILDIMLPEKNGIELLKQIRSKSKIPVLMLTALGDEVDKLLGLELGADDYIVKPFSPRELVARLKAVLRRYRDSSEEDSLIIRHGDFLFDKEAKSVFYKDRALPFTASEVKIALKLAENPKRVFTRSELIEVISSEYVVDDRVIDAHIKNMRRKLSEVGAPDFIETVRGFGYSFKRSLSF